MKTSLPLGLVLLAAGCASAPPPPPPAPAAASTESPAPGQAVVELSLAQVGLSAEAIDRSANPCEDFYQFACGGWLAATEIPSDRSRWSRSFNEIDKRNQEELRRILETARATPTDDPVLAKIGAYYGACMDEAAVEEAGTKALSPMLAAAGAVKDRQSLARAVTLLHRNQVWALFDLGASQSFKDATQMIAYLDQNGLGLPDRDYYLKDDERSKELRQAYEQHVARMLTLAGQKPKDAAQGAKAVLRLETQLARAAKSRVERRDPAGLYNRVDRAGLQKLVPAFDWNGYFAALGQADLDAIAVTSIPYFEAVQKLVETVKPADWRPYLTWHVVRASARDLPPAFVDEQFALTRLLTGQPQLEERWKRCVKATDGALGELLAQPYVRAMFGGHSKEATERMVAEIAAAFGEELSRIDWMDAPTKEKAREKLDAMAYMIGYPDKWKTYGFEVDPRANAANALASRAFEMQRDLGRIGKPVDRSEWFMSPPTVNAYYSPLKNQMVFPAGILQPPFFSPDAGVAVNLGGIGMVVGHELTHGFDDKGSQFAADGNLHSWWTPEVADRFREKTRCVAEQYGHMEALPGLKLNGELTLGENIADNGGVKLAYAAYRSMRRDAPEQIVADGFTEDQQYFLAVAQSWCSKSREEVARMLVTVDPHSPPAARVNGSLANRPEFGEAFRCEVGSPMRPENACQVW